MAKNTQAQPAMIFIPDISGFTKFVSETEIDHSQHIITELLEVLINANNSNLEISEIEGDAILFYRFGPASTAEESLGQIEKMFIAFHEHLIRYENRRICQCGACKTAHELTLKFVVHFGKITLNKISNHTKLFGKEVIVAHRLLKNNIPHHEYVLFTKPFLEDNDTWKTATNITWTNFENSQQTYDSGLIEYSYLALAPLMKKLKPIEKLPPIMTGNPVKVFESSHLFQVPPDILFSKLIDLNYRPQWGGVEIEMISSHEFNREGTVHQCILPNNQRPEFITENIHLDTSKYSFDETDVNGKMSNRWIIERKTATETLVSTQIWMKNNFFLKLFFRLFMKAKFSKLMQTNFNKLEGLLQEEFKNKGEWQRNIVLEDVA